MKKLLITIVLVVFLVLPALGEDKPSDDEFKNVMPWVTGSKRDELKKSGILQWTATGKINELEGDELKKIETFLKSRGHNCGTVLEAHTISYEYPHPKTGVIQSTSVGTWNPKTRKIGIYAFDKFKSGKIRFTNAYTGSPPPGFQEPVADKAPPTPKLKKYID